MLERSMAQGEDVPIYINSSHSNKFCTVDSLCDIYILLPIMSNLKHIDESCLYFCFVFYLSSSNFEFSIKQYISKDAAVPTELKSNINKAWFILVLYAKSDMPCITPASPLNCNHLIILNLKIIIFINIQNSYGKSDVCENVHIFSWKGTLL